MAQYIMAREVRALIAEGFYGVVTSDGASSPLPCLACASNIDLEAEDSVSVIAWRAPDDSVSLGYRHAVCGESAVLQWQDVRTILDTVDQEILYRVAVVGNHSPRAIVVLRRRADFRFYTEGGTQPRSLWIEDLLAKGFQRLPGRLDEASPRELAGWNLTEARGRVALTDSAGRAIVDIEPEPGWLEAVREGGLLIVTGLDIDLSKDEDGAVFKDWIAGTDTEDLFGGTVRLA